MWTSMFDGEAELSPPAADEALAGLPAKRGLALLLAEGGRPVLLLPAANLRARVAGRLRSPDEQERRRLPDLAAVTRKVLWRLAHSHFECDLRFLEISRRLWPQTYTGLLAWKPAWFIGVDLGADYPHFSRTQEVGKLGERIAGVPPARTAGVSPAEMPAQVRPCEAMDTPSAARTGETPVPPNRCFGPFPGGSSAQRFIDALADGFLLCRDLRFLRQAPHARRCSYGQMGRCLCPCDGSISPADYRAAVAEAADFAAGARRPAIERLRDEMRQAAASLHFERASALKARLARLAELEGSDYAHVAPAEEFRFLLIQRGPKRRKLLAFLADAASIKTVGEIDYPPKTEQFHALAGRACLPDKQAQDIPGEQGRAGMPDLQERRTDRAARSADKWIMGLVAHYLFASPRRRGLILPLRAGLTAEELAQEIEKAAEVLGLKRPAPESGRGA